MRFLLFVFALISTVLVSAGKEINFNQDVRPILSDRCFHCHGPDEESREKKLRFDLADGPEGAYRVRKGKAAIKPGSLKDSLVWQRLVTDDEDDIMPPLDSHKKQLTAKERAIIKQWIEEGAVYEGFWAFQKPVKKELPKVTFWTKAPIDLLVQKSLEEQSLRLVRSADKRTLIRRVTFDITGLPPTLIEIKNFLEDKSSTAYKSLVERLLAKKQYGEHMAKYWFDLVRFADTNGMHKDFYRNFTYYREWVIKSFNNNLKYDDFLKYQLAGDLYEKPTEDQLIASGFNRMHLIIDRGTALPEESHVKNVIDRVTAVSTAFLGLTVQCARCHDHKYDPISQKDFYSLYAFFNNLDGKPETSGGPANGLQAPMIKFPSPERDKKIAQFDKQINALNKEFSGLTEQIAKEKAPLKKKKLETAKKGKYNLRRSLQGQRRRLSRMVDGAMVMKERAVVNPTYILELAQYDKPGEKVERNTPAFLPPLKKKKDLASRMDLANWFVSPENPLTARVAVNRLWQQFFGVGLVKTSEDLGAQGEVPSHPELLDYLAVSFTESGWDMKALVKEIVLSKTYQQNSVTSTERFKSDPENRLLARGSRFRMDSEMIRDQILATSGLLSLKMYGRSVMTPQPDGLWKAVSMIGERFRADKGESIYRRSVYTHWKRSMPPPQMAILNAPSREACIARRERTNTPIQALLLLNETEYMKAARQLAQKVISLKNLKDSQKLKHAFEVVTSKLPDYKDRRVLSEMLIELKKEYSANPKLAKEMCEGITLSSQTAFTELAAWTMVINTLYNLDITKTRE